MTLLRREFGKLVLAGTAGATLHSPDLWSATKLDSAGRGVKLGLITGSLGGGGSGGPGGGSGGRGGGRGAPPAVAASGPSGRDPVDNLIGQCIAVGAANIECAGPAVGKPQLLDGVIGQPLRYRPTITGDRAKKFGSGFSQLRPIPFTKPGTNSTPRV